MTKQDWIWVAIRIFGIYLLVLAIVALPNLLGSLVVLYHTWGVLGTKPVMDMGQAGQALAELSRNVSVANVERSIGALSRVLLYGGIGLYFIKSGKLIYRWVFPPDAPTNDASSQDDGQVASG